MHTLLPAPLYPRAAGARESWRMQVSRNCMRRCRNFMLRFSLGATARIGSGDDTGVHTQAMAANNVLAVTASICPMVQTRLSGAPPVLYLTLAIVA